MSNYDFNLRGMLIVPQDKTAIQYYLCFMDVPDGLSSTDFIAVNTNPAYVPNPPQPENVCYYNCSKNLSDYANLPATKTIALPMYVFSPYSNKTNIIVMDIAQNTTTGNPNKGIPPTVPMQANPDSDYTTTNIIVNSISFDKNYFVVVIASSVKESKDVSNYFRSMILEDANLVCTLETSGGASTYQAPIGVYTVASENTRPTTSQVSGGNTAQPIIWNGKFFTL